MSKLTHVHFIHFRTEDKDGNIQPKGGATVCYVPDTENNTHRLGISFCSPRDRFVKKVGRSCALGRGNINTPHPGFLSWDELRTQASNLVESTWSRICSNHPDYVLDQDFYCYVPDHAEVSEA